MKAYEVQEGWGLENLRIVERPDPTPGPGQVRVRMRAVSLNFRDLLTVRGHYNPRQPLPLIPLSDGCGVIDAVGDGVRRWKVGDRVSPIFCQRWESGPPDYDKLRSSLGGPLDGTFAELAVFPEGGLVAPPEHLTDAEAATLPCAAVTAWSALVEQGDVHAGDTVLVQGTGGVSLFALQIAKLLGARVIVTSSSDDKLARARELGADECINYRTEPEWGAVARALTGRRGVDHVVEVGGAGTMAQSLKAIRVGGSISVIGVLASAREPLNVLPILMQNIRLQGILVGHREGFEAMNRALALHESRPVVDREFAWEDARGAFEHMAAGAHFGKIVVRVR